jgi:uncharacterized protein YndB with AHSA1/START domain
MPTAQQGRASVDIAAPPELVYDLITDVTRMGDWGPECYRCEWLDGATAPSIGARFRGYDRRGGFDGNEPRSSSPTRWRSSWSSPWPNPTNLTGYSVESLARSTRSGSSKHGLTPLSRSQSGTV